MEILTGNLQIMLTTIVLSMIMVYVFKQIADFNLKRVAQANANEVINGGNKAIAIRRAGMYLGIMIGALGTMTASIGDQIFNQFLMLGFMGVTFIISDKIVFKDVSNTLDIAKGNVSLALAEAGLFIATGIIAYASFAGEGVWYSSIVFFILGQLLFLTMTKVYEKLYSDIDEKVLAGNQSAGIMLGSLMIAFALILKSAIIGDFVSWEADLQSFFIMSGVGFLLLILLANIIVDKIFLPGITIKEAIENDNVAPIILISAMKIGIAVLINSAI